MGPERKAPENVWQVVAYRTFKSGFNGAGAKGSGKPLEPVAPDYMDQTASMGPERKAPENLNWLVEVAVFERASMGPERKAPENFSVSMAAQAGASFNGAGAKGSGKHNVF